MNPAAWFAFAVSAAAATVLAVWALLIVVGLVRGSEAFDRTYRDGMFVVVSFFLTGLAAILVGAYE